MAYSSIKLQNNWTKIDVQSEELLNSMRKLVHLKRNQNLDGQEWKKLSVGQIRKICSAAPNRLKAIAEKEGHQVE